MLRAKADGQAMRDIARLFWRESHVEDAWDADGWMHARLKRRLRRAREIMRRWHEIAAGR